MNTDRVVYSTSTPDGTKWVPAPRKARQAMARIAAPKHLSMPDPCPHFDRIDFIMARLQGSDVLAQHLINCTGEDN